MPIIRTDSRGSFSAKFRKNQPLFLPPRQADWYQYKEAGVVRWRPCRFELQFIGGIWFSHLPLSPVIGSFNNDLLMLPPIFEIDLFLKQHLYEKTIVWTPNRKSVENVDKTEWAALCVSIRRTNNRTTPWTVNFKKANESLFDIFDVNKHRSRLELYVAKDQRQIYRSRRFW